MNHVLRLFTGRTINPNSEFVDMKEQVITFAATLRFSDVGLAE